MLRSLLERLGFGSTRETPSRPPLRVISVEHAQPNEKLPEQNDLPKLSPEAIRFFQFLVRPPGTSDLQELPQGDRLFLSEIMKRLRENAIEIPVLPGTAIEVSRLLADPTSSMGDFVKVLESDPAMSVSVLRTANSAFYGFANPTNSLRDAVFRIGLSQLRTIVILSHLQGKILQTGMFEQEVKWLSDLSLALAQLGQVLASDLGLEPSVAFTRGTLWHLEHFLIMGAMAEVTRQHRAKTHPSEECLHEAFFRFGPKIRELAARLWEMEALLSSDSQEDELARRYTQLRSTLVADWTGADISQEVDGISAQRLAQALKRLSP